MVHNGFNVVPCGRFSVMRLVWCIMDSVLLVVPSGRFSVVRLVWCA